MLKNMKVLWHTYFYNISLNVLRPTFFNRYNLPFSCTQTIGKIRIKVRPKANYPTLWAPAPTESQFSIIYLYWYLCLLKLDSIWHDNNHTVVMISRPTVSQCSSVITFWQHSGKFASTHKNHSRLIFTNIFEMLLNSKLTKTGLDHRCLSGISNKHHKTLWINLMKNNFSEPSLLSKTYIS